MEDKLIDVKIYGYFIHLTFKYFICDVENGMLRGFDISKFGKLQTMTIHKDNVDQLVWLDLGKEIKLGD